MIDKLEMPEEIKCDRFKLVRRTHEYDEQILNIVDKNHQFLVKYLNWPQRTDSMDKVLNETKLLNEAWTNGNRFYYLLIDKTHKVLGAIYVLNVDHKHHSAEFGFWLAEDATGKGYISEGLKELEKSLFKKDFVRLVMRCEVDNPASNKVAQKCGYDFEGLMKKARATNGIFSDSNLYAKINPKYRD